MNVQLNPKQKAIHDRAVYLTRCHSHLELDRIENLIEVEANEVHKAFGKKMFVYATKTLEIDSGIAYPYISVARACVKFPSLRRALHEGLTVCKAGRMVSILNKENAEELIQFAKIHSKHEIEEEVAKRNPKAGKGDRIRPLNAEYDELTSRLKKTGSQKLKRVFALNPTRDWGETLEEMADFYLDRKDPIRKVERAEKRATKPATKPAHAKNFGPAGLKRTPPKAKAKHSVNLRDRGCCTFIGPDGKRCNDDRWTESHHIIPVSLGGTNDPDNLTTLCSFHHDLVHQQSLPIDGQVTWLR